MGSLDQASYEFAALAMRLRYAAGGGLRDDLYKAVNDAAMPVIAGIRDGLEVRHPRRYFAETLDPDLALTVSKRTAGSEPGVRITARTRGTRRRIRQLDGGVLDHPLWGDRDHWYRQDVTPGWFSGPARRAGPAAREEILSAMRRTAGQITGKG